VLIATGTGPASHALIGCASFLDFRCPPAHNSAMRKRVYIALAVVLVILAGVIAWQVLRLRSTVPTWDGRSLTHWITALGNSDDDEEARAFAAIEAIGTNGLPVIIRLLGTRDSALGFQFLRLVERVPLLHLQFTTPSERRQKAKMALFLAGGESMRASIPDLMRLARDSDPGVRLTAVEALSAFPSNETSALAALETAQADTDSRVRTAAQQAVQSQKTVDREVQRLRKLWPDASLKPKSFAR
jgi:hypothetical protein